MKKKSRTRSSEKSGLPPGTLVYVGERQVEELEISVFDFNETSFDERRQLTVDECLPYLDSETISWINIVGLHDVVLLKEIGEKFDIDPLVMEDILNTEQRPKVQDLKDYLFVVLKMTYPLDGVYQSEQISLIMKNRCVISFQERREDVFDSIRDRIRGEKGRIRKSGADYLLYALVDSIVDAYFPYLEGVSESLEEIEAKIIESQEIASLQELHQKKRELISIRRSIWPTREIVSFLERGESAIIKQSTIPYLRDVHEHIVRIIETVESLKDVLTSMLELYMSSSSHRMNEVMKVLTIISTIFMPVTFVAAIYGMNFVYMPELTMKAAYPAVILVMAGIALGMVAYFKRKKWL